MTKKVLVTGGAGFIGSHLAKKLVADGHRVVVVDNMSEGKKEYLSEIESEIEFFREDIRNLDKLVEIFEGVDTVFHHAALRSVKRSVDNPIASNDHNITGTLNVYEAAKRRGVRRVIFSSSSSVYGKTDKQVFVETDRPNPQSPYALTKLAGEIYARLYHELYELDTVCLRYFNVFGPGQDPHGEYAVVVPLFIEMLKNNQAPTIHWDGEQSRDFTHIDNVVEANLLALKADKIAGEIFNISAGESYSINYLYKQISKLLHKNIKPSFGEMRAGDVRHTCGDNSKAKERLGFGISVGFEEGLKRTVEWFANN